MLPGRDEQELERLRTQFETVQASELALSKEVFEVREKAEAAQRKVAEQQEQVRLLLPVYMYAYTLQSGRASHGKTA